jgi:hypothetical protein
MAHREVQNIFDTGPFGYGNAGHSHSDTLSLVVRYGDRNILIDPGTYTYISSPKWRNLFRGSSAHNTIRLDGLDQAIGTGPFRWSGKPEVEVLHAAFTPERDFVDAVCRYSGFTHRRRIVFRKPDLIFILDDLDGEAGKHVIEQFWHPGEPVTTVCHNVIKIGYSTLVLSPWGTAEVQDGWRSPALGTKTKAPVIRVSQICELPVRLGTALDLSGELGPTQDLVILEEKDTVSLCLEDDRRELVRLFEDMFPE